MKNSSGRFTTGFFFVKDMENIFQGGRISKGKRKLIRKTDIKSWIVTLDIIYYFVNNFIWFIITEYYFKEWHHELFKIMVSFFISNDKVIENC